MSPFLPERSEQPLAGQLVVFTGKLNSFGRRDARALVARLGGQTADEVSARTTMLVVGSEGFGTASEADPSTGFEVPSGGAAIGSADPRRMPRSREGRIGREKSNKLKRAEELNADPSVHIEIVSEAEFCRLAGVPTPETLKRQYHAMRDLMARYRSLREDHLRYLVKCGVIRPVLRTNADSYFAFPDLAVIKQANDQLRQGAAFGSFVRGLISSRHGQLAFDFRLEAPPARILTLQRPIAESDRSGGPSACGVEAYDRAGAEEYFRQGSSLDAGDESTLEEAEAMYRKALELDPCLAAALINLANIHYSRDELVEAQALYCRAIDVEADFFEAHFNLGNIHHDLGRFGEAQACYEEALRLNPFYADAHFYLAVTLEKMGMSHEARPHWRAYQQLAPKGEWVELAREFSE